MSAVACCSILDLLIGNGNIETGFRGLGGGVWRHVREEVWHVDDQSRDFEDGMFEMWLKTGFLGTFTAYVSVVGKELRVISSCSCVAASESENQPQVASDALALPDSKILTRPSLGHKHGTPIYMITESTLSGIAWVFVTFEVM
jgi:hypothetical protein